VYKKSPEHITVSNMILGWLSPFLITFSNRNMNGEVLWVSLDERVFEHLRLVGDHQGIWA